MNTETRVRILLGNKDIEICALQARVEELEAELAGLRPKVAEPAEFGIPSADPNVKAV